MQLTPRRCYSACSVSVGVVGVVGGGGRRGGGSHLEVNLCEVSNVRSNRIRGREGRLEQDLGVSDLGRKRSWAWLSLHSKIKLTEETLVNVSEQTLSQIPVRKLCNRFLNKNH